MVRFMDKNYFLEFILFSTLKKEQRFLPALKDWVSALSNGMKNFFDRLARYLGGEKALNVINSSSDILLALFIIVLIMMIIIPVSPGIHR